MGTILLPDETPQMTVAFYEIRCHCQGVLAKIELLDARKKHQFLESQLDDDGDVFFFLDGEIWRVPSLQVLSNAQTQNTSFYGLSLD